MRRLAVPLVLSVFSLGFNPNDQRAQNGTYGLGAASCGEWLAKKDNAEMRFGQTQWLLGYVSGVGDGFDLFKPDDSAYLLERSDHNAMTMYIDNFCRDNPLKKVREG